VIKHCEAGSIACIPTGPGQYSFKFSNVEFVPDRRRRVT
jgi:hypothetical protein